ERSAHVVHDAAAEAVAARTGATTPDRLVGAERRVIEGGDPLVEQAASEAVASVAAAEAVATLRHVVREHAIADAEAGGAAVEAAAALGVRAGAADGLIG